jgi:predicted CopG family antitoxin
MSKPATLSEEAYKVLKANKRNEKESLSSVILRFVPHPIKTFGDLEKHLNNLEAPLALDWEALERVRERKRRHAH